jgi:two-component system chemotaxis response regulator CheY
MEHQIRIIVVDDEELELDNIARALKREGWEYQTFLDPIRALENIKEEDYDIALLDFRMPNMDGITIVSELRKLPAFRFTPILLLTTEGAKEKKMQGKAAGATGWLVKPFDPDKLRATVRKVLR